MTTHWGWATSTSRMTSMTWPRREGTAMQVRRPLGRKGVLAMGHGCNRALHALGLACL
jgi:hypothetical protein